MQQKDLRTYQRRSVTRESGYHTCGETTGGECLVVRAENYETEKSEEIFVFEKTDVELMELFEKNIGIFGFGGYIYTDQDIKISFKMKYTMNGQTFVFEKDSLSPIEKDNWNNIGFHKEISLDNGYVLSSVVVQMIIETKSPTELEFISFDMGAITKDEFADSQLGVSFYQKISMCIPYLYYLDTTLSIRENLKERISTKQGRIVVLKSCNRCGRFIPINIFDEMNTLGFSLHCKKRAPCVHSTFRAYTILNYKDLSPRDLKELPLEVNKVVTYYGHQLECKACKKFFVNAPLNPQRNTQQLKEDGLRRRALEVLINNLLEKNLIHFEYETRTKKEFSEHIWKKFGGRCFKCNKKIPLDEMHLDHTMPLAYLYRLDESATCLCAQHNSQKSDHFPVDFYSQEELVKLSKITGLSMEVLQKRTVNEQVLQPLVDKVVWFYDEFLMNKVYQKVQDNILTADKINDSLKRVIAGKVDLANEYKKRTGHYPKSVTIVK
jgi:hypothetical protein